MLPTMSDSENGSVGSDDHASAVRRQGDGTVRKLRKRFEPSTSRDLVLPTDLRRSARQAAASQAVNDGKRPRPSSDRASGADSERAAAHDVTSQSVLARVSALETGQQQLRADFQQSQADAQQAKAELQQNRLDLATAQAELRQCSLDLATTKTELAAARAEVAELRGSVDTRLQAQASNSAAAADQVKDQLQQQLNAESSTVEHLNQRVRTNNIVMHGVPDTAAYSRPADLDSYVKDELDSAAPSRTAEPLSKAVIGVRRIGRPGAGTNPGKRAVVVEFATSQAKHQAFQLSSCLRPRGIRLSDELTHKQLQAQRQLEADSAALKAKGYHPFYRQGKLKYMDQGVLRTCQRGDATRVTPCPPGAAQPGSSAPLGRPGAQRGRSRRTAPTWQGSPRPHAAATGAPSLAATVTAARAAMDAAATATAADNLPPPPPPQPPGGTAGAASSSASPQ